VIRQSRHRSLVGGVAVLAAAGLLAACSSSSSPTAASSSASSSATTGGASNSAASSGSGGGSATMTTVTMGVNPYVGLAPLYLGIKQGFFKAAGINLKLVTVPSSPAILQAVIAKQDDIGFAVTTSVITAAAKGAQAKCIGPIAGNVTTDSAEYSTGIVIKGGSSITSAKDLAGKKVAVAALGGEQAILAQEAVDKAGGDWKSVKLVPLAFGVMNTSLKSGDVDAITSTQPFVNQAVAAGGKVLSWAESDLMPGWTTACTVANNSFISAHPDAVAGYQKALGESIDYAKAHVDEARAELPSITGITADLAKTTPLGVTYDSKFNVQSMSDMQTLMVQYGYIKAPLPLNQVLDYPGVS
jgi:NitT/TauT family transport system substrate-binding protein